jgi:hypothetical protein
MDHIFSNQIFSLILSLAIISFIIYRQISARKISLKSLVIFPLIILYFMLEALPSFHPSQTKILEISIISIVSITLGLLACRQLHVYKGASGKAMMKGSWTYFLWWLAAFVVKSLLSVLFGETSFKSVNQFEIFLPVFLLMLSRNAYVYWRTRQLGLELH